MITILEINDLKTMLEQFEIIKHLYPNLKIETYKNYLTQMLQHNYTQVLAIKNNKCVGLSGCWTGIKIWCGSYIEIDNFIVHPNYRKQGIAKALVDYINDKAKKLGVNLIVLDAYVNNYNAHRFYYNQGYHPKGFHFMKILNENGLT